MPPRVLQFPGDPGFNTNSRPSNTQLNDFAPRLGMVWDPKGDGRMTIRASWGMFYELPHTLFAYGFSQAPPWGENINRTNVFFADPWGPGQNDSAAFPGGDPFPLTSRIRISLSRTSANTPLIRLDIKPTYLEQWNLSIQKQIGANWLVSASYLGNNTVHLWADAPINAAVYIPGNCVCGTVRTHYSRRLLDHRQPELPPASVSAEPGAGKFYGTIHSLDDRIDRQLQRAAALRAAPSVEPLHGARQLHVVALHRRRLHIGAGWNPVHQSP